MGACEEESGVDGAGDSSAGADDGGDGDVQDIGDVACGERALGLLNHDDGVVGARSSRQGAQREVARTAQHGET